MVPVAAKPVRWAPLSNINVVVDQAKAYVDASQVGSADGIEVTATESAVLSALSLGAAVAGAGGAEGGFGGAGSGSVALNVVANTVGAYIVGSTGAGKGVSSASGAIRLTANDAAVLTATAGSLDIAGAGGSGGGTAVAVGASIATNIMVDTVKAFIDASSVSTSVMTSRSTPTISRRSQP